MVFVTDIQLVPAGSVPLSNFHFISNRYPIGRTIVEGPALGGFLKQDCSTDCYGLSYFLLEQACLG